MPPTNDRTSSRDVGAVSPAKTVTATTAALCPTRHLTQVDLARRWRLSERTLETWRSRKTGPPYLRIGGKVIYRVSDVLAYESAHLRQGDR